MIERKEIQFDDCKVWNNTNFFVKRKLLVSKETIIVDYKGEKISQPKYKYEEVVCFENDCNDIKNKAICIGYNPALAIKEIDATNKRLITILAERKYSGYVLYNLYPEVTIKKDIVNKEDPENINNLNFMYDKIINSNINDVILFFGRTAEIKDFVNSLKQINDKKHVMLTCFDNEFIHPGAIGTFELQNFKEEYIRNRSVQQIRIQEE